MDYRRDPKGLKIDFNESNIFFKQNEYEYNTRPCRA